MADKKISQLVERFTTASTDVFPVVFVGATETQKVKASTIFTYIKNTLVSGIIQATTDTDKFLVQDGTEIKYRTGAEVLNDVLPNQSGNTGKVLKTDGTTASWQTESGSTGVQSVTGTIVNNTDPLNPVINVPTLQQVTDSGLQTNDSIKLENGFDIYDSANAQWIEARGGDGFVALKIAGALQEFFVAEIGLIAIKDGVNKTAIIDVNNIPASTTKTFSLPNISGSSATLVTSVNGTSAGTNGDVTISVVGTQDLQSVTDINNATTNPIYSTNVGNTTRSSIGTSIISGIPEVICEDDNTQKIASLTSEALSFTNGIAINTAKIKATNISGSIKDIELPNASGTIVLSVNGTAPNTSGDVTIPTGATLTLQDVTNNGNSTSDGILLGVDGVSVYDPFQTQHIEITGSNGLFVQFAGSVDSFLECGFAQLKFGETIKSIFDNSILTASRTYNMPNANGTLVLSVNGTSPNASGDVTIAVGGSQTLQQTTDLGNTTTNDIEFIDAGVIEADYVDYKLVPTSPVVIQEGRTTWNDDLKTLQVHTENIGVQIDVGHDLIQRVVNNTGVTINKGAVVYINGEQGGRPTITLADNSSDPTSATTFGIVMANIPNNQNGYVITNGLLSGIDTSSFTAGQQLYLGSSGAFIGTKPVQPLHSVYIAKVISVSVTGSIFVSIQNGLELEELHDCLITSPANGQLLTYESSTGLWKNQNAPTELPTQTGNNGKFLFTNGTSASWSFPSRHYKLGFNNISDYVVNGGAGTQNLGGGTLGMSLTQDLQSLLYAISGSNYVIKCKVITAEQFGGVTNQIGLRITYSSANGVFSTDQLVIAARTGQFGSNFAIQTADLNFTIPIQYNGANTDYFKFEVIMNRTAGGSTSVFHSELIFSV